MWAKRDKDRKMIGGPIPTLPIHHTLEDGRQLGANDLRTWSEEGEGCEDGLKWLAEEGFVPVVEDSSVFNSDTHMITSYIYENRENDVLQMAVIEEKPIVEKSLIQKGIATQIGLELTDAVIVELDKPENALLKTIISGGV